MTGHGPEAGAVRDCAAAVLAGGKGKRLGMDKLSLEIDGKRILDRILSLLQGLFPCLLLVVQQNSSLPRGDVPEGIRVVEDIIPGKGPLGGIYTALEYSPLPYVFVMACDMPSPSKELILHLVSESPGKEAVVPRRGPYIEPLFAVYSRSLAPRMRCELEGGLLKIYEFIRNVDVKYVEEEEIASRDPLFRSFLNINTPEDLERFRERGAGEAG